MLNGMLDAFASVLTCWTHLKNDHFSNFSSKYLKISSFDLIFKTIKTRINIFQAYAITHNVGETKHRSQAPIVNKEKFKLIQKMERRLLSQTNRIIGRKKILMERIL